MKFPPTNHSNQRLTTSKLRFLCNGTGDVYVKCYFSQLSITYSTLLGPWKPYPGGIDHALRSLLDTSQQNENRPTITVQLLTKKRSFFLSLEEIEAASDEVQTFTLEPNAWMEAFGYHSPEEQRKINEQLIARIRLLEHRAERKRVREKKRVFGRERLIAQVFDTTYRPRRKGRRMWCLSEKRSVRVEFIRFFRALMQKAREVRERWKLGDVTVPYPPGLYPPSMPKLANAFGR